jgi:hypothetical protein
MMKENTAALPAQYQSYLLRLWHEDEDGHSSWRASLENSRTGGRVGFANLEQLFAYLMSQTEGRATDGFVNTGDQV